MDDKRGDARPEDLTAALREDAGDLGPHLGTKRLIAYRQGTLPAEEREEVQEHLSLCAQCLALLRELRDFEAAAAGGAAAGPESQRQNAWNALARRLPERRLPEKAPAVRPLAAASLDRQAPVTDGAPPDRRSPRWISALAAGLLLALAGLFLSTVSRQREEAAEESIAVSPSAEELPVAAAPLAVSVAPRFLLRGVAEEPVVLRGGGAANPVRPEAGSITVAFDPGGHPPYGEYRLELLDRNGNVLWTGSRPSASVVGDAGTLVSIAGLAPGRYRLRIHGLGPGQGDLLGEYLLEAAEAPR